MAYQVAHQVAQAHLVEDQASLDWPSQSMIEKVHKSRGCELFQKIFDHLQNRLQVES